MKLIKCEVLCWWLILSSVWTRAESLNNTCDTFYLLNLYPAPDESSSTGFDKGFELIPAGHLAIQHINNDSSILPGHRLELIDVPTEACEQTLIIEGLANYYKQVLNQDSVCIYGIVGLYCSTVTNIIAPIASHPNTGYVQLAASTSPAHRNATNFPYTFHTISSTRVLNEAAVEMMNQFNWRRVTSVFDSTNIFHRSNAAEFKELLGNDTKVLSIPIVPFSSTSNIFAMITEQQTSIGYIADSNNEFFCEAFKRNYLWPHYAYIIIESPLDVVLSSSAAKGCSKDELIKALEGTFLLQYRLQKDNESELGISGRTYSQIRDEYLEELKNFEKEKKMNLEANSYSYTLYDQVWALALAMNLSLNDINVLSSSISRDNLNDRVFVRKILAENLKEVDFIGVSGTVKFRENEVFTPVEIYQIQNGTEVRVGTYNSSTKNITFDEIFDRQEVPSGTFDMRHLYAPLWVGILVITASTVLLLLSLFNTAVTIILKKRPEIKSGSFSLSLVILLGCFIHSTSPIFATALVISTPLATALVISTPLAFTLVCNLELWTFILGFSIILTALLMRLLRIYKIFRPYSYSGKYWSDKYLLLYVTLTCSVILVLLVTWAVVDPYKHKEDVQYIRDNLSPPYYLQINSCSSKYFGIWFTVALSFIGCLMTLLVFLAIQTRHVKIKDFKDTKKVNMFIFGVCMSYAIFLPLWLILLGLGFQTGAYVCHSIAVVAGATLCQVFLLLPKTIPAISKRWSRIAASAHYVQQNNDH